MAEGLPYMNKVFIIGKQVFNFFRIHQHLKRIFLFKKSVVKLFEQ